MDVRKISKRLANYDEVVRVYEEAFPAYERFPMWLILLLSKFKGNDFLAFYDDGNFVGLANAYESKKTVYILFLAVNGAVRSKGYGSKILNWLKQNYPNKTLFLSVEPDDAEASNAEQRKRRFAFYRKNGFVDTGCYIKDYAGVFTVLSTDMNFSPENSLSCLQKLFLRIRKIERLPDQNS